MSYIHCVYKIKNKIRIYVVSKYLPKIECEYYKNVDKSSGHGKYIKIHKYNRRKKWHKFRYCDIRLDGHYDLNFYEFPLKRKFRIRFKSKHFISDWVYFYLNSINNAIQMGV